MHSSHVAEKEKSIIEKNGQERFCIEEAIDSQTKGSLLLLPARKTKFIRRDRNSDRQPWLSLACANCFMLVTQQLSKVRHRPPELSAPVRVRKKVSLLHAVRLSECRSRFLPVTRGRGILAKIAHFGQKLAHDI